MKFKAPRPPRPSSQPRVATTPGYKLPVPPPALPKKPTPTRATAPPVPAQRTQEIDLEQMDTVLSRDRRVLDHEWFGDEISEVAIEDYADQRRSVVVRTALLLGVVSIGLTASALVAAVAVA